MGVLVKQMARSVVHVGDLELVQCFLGRVTYKDNIFSQIYCLYKYTISRCIHYIYFDVIPPPPHSAIALDGDTLDTTQDVNYPPGN